MLIQLPESTTHIQNGSLKGWWGDAENAALKPVRPTPLQCCVVSGASLPVKIAPQAAGALRLLARCNGAFLADKQVDVFPAVKQARYPEQVCVCYFACSEAKSGKSSAWRGPVSCILSPPPKHPVGVLLVIREWGR